jgi:hypothetical protein
MLIADNNTYLKASILSDGIARFSVNTRRKYLLYFAHPNYQSFQVEDIDPAVDFSIKVQSSENIGSIICTGTCYIPGLKGRLNPILDTSLRTYLYADNIAVNGGVQQPAMFSINSPIELEDCDGVCMELTVKGMKGRISLLEYVSSLSE